MESKRRSESERGVALMLCLFALLLLTTIGMGLMFMANMETSVNYNYRAAQQAYYDSKAGLEEARERLRFGSTYSITPPTGIPGTGNAAGILYILNTPSTSDDAVDPSSSSNAYYDNELCTEQFFNSAGANSLFSGFTPTIGVPCDTSHLPPSGTFTTHTSIDPGYNTNAALGYKWVRITAKQNCSAGYGVDGTAPGSCNSSNVNRNLQVCVDLNNMVNGVPRETLLPAAYATCELAKMRPVFLVTSLASSKRAASIPGTGARRMTQYEIASATLPPLPAALTLDGPTPTINVNFPNSNANIFDGNDHGTPGCTPGPAVPAIATIDPTSNTNVINSLTRPNNYVGVGGAPSVQTVTINPQFSTVGALQQLVANISAGADQTFGDNPTGVNLGNDTNPKVTVVNGNFNMGNSHGAGLLLVTGTFTSQGNPDFNGIILVIGKGVVNLGGGGNGAFNGGMFVANLYDASGALLPANSVPGSPIFTWDGGGTFDFNYSSCWINNLAARLPYKIIASREEMY